MSTPQRDRVDWVPVYNTTNETIPSGAVARVTGVTDGVLQLAKPTAAGDTKVIVVGLTSVPAGKYGRGTFDPRAVAAYDPADGPPAAADQLGSASGSWYLVAGNAGFRALGGAGNGLVNVVREAGSGTPSPLTTKGDVWGYSTTDARIPVGADGQVLTADSTQTLGVKWASGPAWREPCRAATTAAVTLSTALENGDTLDGVVLATGDRVLVKDQAAPAENGIYVVAASGTPARAVDADAAAELVNAVVAVSEGTANADTIWMCYTSAPITLGVTALDWERVYPTTYEDDDSNPSYFGNTLQFDQDDGFSLSQPSRRVVKVDFVAAPLRTNGFGHDVLGTAYGTDSTTYATVDDGGGTFGVTVPEAGTYLVWYDLSCIISGHRDDIGSTIVVRMYDNTNAAAVSGTERYVVSLAYGKVDWSTTEPPPIPIEEYYGSASSQKVITVSGATAYRVQVKLHRTEVTSLDGSVTPDSQIGYVRLA